MINIPILAWVILGTIAVIGASMVPASAWSSLIPAPKAPAKPVDLAAPEKTAGQADLGPQNYLAVQKMLLDARAACGGCPEAVTAIDDAIRATVAIVVKTPAAYVVSLEHSAAIAKAMQLAKPATVAPPAAPEAAK